MALLSNIAFSRLKAALYGAILVLVALRDAWLTCGQRLQDWLWQLAGRYPPCGPLVRALLGSGGREHLGSSPTRPAVLGVVLAQPLHDGGSLSQLALLITWAQEQCFREALLYDPQGWLQRRRLQLEKALDAAGSPLALHVGWPAPQGLSLPPDPLTAARQRRRRRSSGSSVGGGVGASGGGQQPGAGEIEVVLLSAADAHWPLASAACPAASDVGLCPVATAAAAPAAEGGEGHSAAPLGCGSTAGPAGTTGSLCLVHGAACSSGACPLRSSLGAAPAAPGQDSLEGTPASSLEGTPASSCASPHVAPGAEAALANGCHCDGIGGECAQAAGGSGGSNLEEAIAAPSRLRARIQQAAGQAAGTEPDLVLVFGEALTLAGFPPWAVRTSEIYGMGPLQRLTRAALQRTLQRYLGIKQRFGV